MFRVNDLDIARFPQNVGVFLEASTPAAVTPAPKAVGVPKAAAPAAVQRLELGALWIQWPDCVWIWGIPSASSYFCPLMEAT